MGKPLKEWTWEDHMADMEKGPVYTKEKAARLRALAAKRSAEVIHYPQGCALALAKAQRTRSGEIEWAFRRKARADKAELAARRARLDRRGGVRHEQLGKILGG
jgi:hypothetical protein